MQHDRRWIRTNGKAPDFKEQPYIVRYRNGLESKTPYVASQLKWGHHRDGMEDGFDVTHVRKA